MSTFKDLNAHLFAQLDRLDVETLTPEQMEIEAKRAESIVKVSDQILRAAKIQLDAVAAIAIHGDRFKPHLSMIEGERA